MKVLLVDNTQYTASDAVKEGGKLIVKVPVTTLAEFNAICSSLTAENISTIRIATDEGVVYGVHTCINQACASVDDVNAPSEVVIEFSKSSEIEQNIANLQKTQDELTLTVVDLMFGGGE